MGKLTPLFFRQDGGRIIMDRFTCFSTKKYYLVLRLEITIVYLTFMYQILHT